MTKVKSLQLDKKYHRKIFSNLLLITTAGQRPIKKPGSARALELPDKQVVHNIYIDACCTHVIN